MPGYYDEDFEPWVRSIRSIGSAIVQQPLLRAQAQERERRAALTQAKIGTEGAQQEHFRAGAGKLNAETANLIQKGRMVDSIQRFSAQAQQDLVEGRTDTEAVREFSNAASALTGINGDDIIASAQKGIGSLFLAKGKPAEAANWMNPAEMEKARITGNRGQVVQPGGALVKDGKVVFQNPSAASQREGEYEETTEEYPAVEATEGMPAQPAKTHWFKADEPAKPAVPGTPYQPKKVVKTRRKIGDVVASAPAANQPQDPDDPSDPVEESTAPESPSEEVPASVKPPTRIGLNLPKPATFGAKQLDAETAKALLAEVGGDKNKARELARQRGYTF